MPEFYFWHTITPEANVREAPNLECTVRGLHTIDGGSRTYGTSSVLVRPIIHSGRSLIAFSNLVDEIYIELQSAHEQQEPKIQMLFCLWIFFCCFSNHQMPHSLVTFTILSLWCSLTKLCLTKKTPKCCEAKVWEEVCHSVSKIFCSCMQDHYLGHWNSEGSCIL